MTKDEFVDFLENHLFVFFPAIEAWMRDSRDPAALQRKWREVLENCTLEECLSVVDRWVSGDIKAPAAYERELTAANIRGVVSNDRCKRRAERTLHEPDADVTRKRQWVVLAPLYARAQAMQKAGRSIDEIHAEVLAMIPAAPAYDGPRYRCCTCCDRGTVEVWRMDIACAVDRGELELEHARGSYMVACECSAGEHYSEGNKYWTPLPRYSKSNFCRFGAGAMAAERERLREWLDTRTPANYRAEFAAFA